VPSSYQLLDFVLQRFTLVRSVPIIAMVLAIFGLIDVGWVKSFARGDEVCLQGSIKDMRGYHKYRGGLGSLSLGSALEGAFLVFLSIGSGLV